MNNRHIVKRIFICLINFYQKRLRSSKIFLDKTCTFSHTESCSNYAKRMIIESSNIFRALIRIKRRLKLCSKSSLYFHDGIILWGNLYEKKAPHTILIELQENHEKNETIFIILSQFIKVMNLKNAYKKKDLLEKEILRLQTKIINLPQIRLRKGDIILFLKKKFKKNLLFSSVFLPCTMPLFILYPLSMITFIPIVFSLWKKINSISFFKQLIILRKFQVR